MKNQKRAWFHCLLIRWGGGLPEILERCPTQIPKFLIYGTTVLVTAILASVSGGYAIYSISQSQLAAFLLGPLWGFVIFTLDRAILVSMHKPYIPTSDETLVYGEKDINEERRIMRLRALRKELLFKNWCMFLVRLPIALVISFTVSIPIETLIFHDRIEQQWVENKERTSDLTSKELMQNLEKQVALQALMTNQAKDKQTRLFKDPHLIELKKAREELESSVAATKSDIGLQIRIRQANYSRSVDKNGKEHYLLNPRGQQAERWRKKLQQQLNRDEQTLLAHNQEIREKQKQLSEKSTEIDDHARKQEGRLDSLASREDKKQIEVDNYRSQFDRLDLIEKVELLHSLRNNPSILWTSILINLLFLLIEISPVTAKFMTPRGLYDEILEAVEMTTGKEHSIKAKYQLYELMAEINRQIKANKEQQNQVIKPHPNEPANPEKDTFHANSRTKRRTIVPALLTRILNLLF
jgi:hypothetical protein